MSYVIGYSSSGLGFFSPASKFKKRFTAAMTGKKRPVFKKKSKSPFRSYRKQTPTVKTLLPFGRITTDQRIFPSIIPGRMMRPSDILKKQIDRLTTATPLPIPYNWNKILYRPTKYVNTGVVGPRPKPIVTSSKKPDSMIAFSQAGRNNPTGVTFKPQPPTIPVEPSETGLKFSDIVKVEPITVMTTEEAESGGKIQADTSGFPNWAKLLAGGLILYMLISPSKPRRARRRTTIKRRRRR